jgi:geranylgeranyl diphosphate synthase, type I
VKSEVDALLHDSRVHIDSALRNFVTSEVESLNKIGSELAPAGDSLARFILDSGKRLRPTFAIVGYLGSGKSPSPSIFSAAASLELIHVCALIHDDLMDGSDTRRGAPSIHKEFEAEHRSEARAGNPQQYGASAAILLGDLSLVWASKALAESGISNSEILGTLPIFNELQIELMAGQYLDIYEQSLNTSSIERSLKIARYKSGKYTIERPLHFGAALANKKELNSSYSAYGIPLGEAFQLRDDVLGVFGESSVTGKPAGDDILEGKRTALIAKAYELADASGALALSQVLGNRKATQDMIDKVKSIISDSGALKFIEDLIEEYVSESLKATKDLPNESLLIRLAELTTKRSF